MSSSLRGVMLFARDVVKTAALYEQGLNLRVLSCTPTFAEISGGSNGQSKIYLFQQPSGGESDSSSSVPSSSAAPLLSFHVEDVQTTLNRLLRFGSTLDGPVQFTDGGQVRISENSCEFLRSSPARSSPRTLSLSFPPTGRRPRLPGRSPHRTD